MRHLILLFQKFRKISEIFKDTFIILMPTKLFVSKTIVFALFVAVLIVFGTSSSVWAAQLDARINPDSPSSSIEIKYQRTIFIEYDQGGQLADELRGKFWSTSTSGGITNPEVLHLMTEINKKIRSDGSLARLTDLNVDYSAQLNGRALSASIDYKLVLEATLSDYIIRERQGQTPALIDMGWRGISVDGLVTIDGVEINMPISAIKDNDPSVYNKIAGTEAQELLSQSLINAEGIKNQPLTNWHFLFDPTGINVDAGTFGLDESITGFVVSGYTMGESSFREGRVVEKVAEAQFILDKTYLVRSIESADNANVHIIGFANIDNLEGLEIFGVTPTAPEGFGSTSSGQFPVSIIYGMAGMAAVGGAGIFIFSNRKLKQEAKMGSHQTGIDPSRLRAYQTSAGAGGYQTVRGEAQLVDDSDYAKSRSVYDEQKPAETKSDSESKKGALPKGWKS